MNNLVKKSCESKVLIIMKIVYLKGKLFKIIMMVSYVRPTAQIRCSVLLTHIMPISGHCRGFLFYSMGNTKPCNKFNDRSLRYKIFIFW